MIKLTVQQVHNRATDNSFKRGQSYQRDGAIFDTVRRGNDIEGFCQGSDVRPYQVKASLNERGIGSTSCTCQYDFAGDCKHIVALLLTYVADPQAFVERPKLEDSLADRDKDELIALIGQMVKRYPDLQILVERPTPGKTRSTPVVNTDSFRHELRHAMREFDEWEYNRPGVDAVESVTEAAEAFEQKDDWHSASLIYRAILEEVMADSNAFQWQDEEGDLSMALDEVIMALGKCLDHLAEDATIRAEIFKSILDVVMWNINDAGRDIGLDAFDDILRHVKPEDIGAIRAQIKPSLERKRRDVYGQWGIEVYESFLSDLDTLDNVDPEVTLLRLREQGLYRVLFEKLLALGRDEEAIAVVREHLTDLSERLIVLPRLVEAGYDDTAIQLARELLNFRQSDDYASQFHNNTVIEWLLTRYTARGDQPASLELQLERMKAIPRIEFYRELKNTAQNLDRWQTLYPAIIQQLEKTHLFDVLTRVYMEEENWDNAWETLEKTGKSQTSPIWQHGIHLDLEVAIASGLATPERAIPVYRKYAQKAIDQRNRQSYQQAAGYLATLRDMYRKIGSEAEWSIFIADIKTEFKKLPALQDELKRARL